MSKGRHAIDYLGNFIRDVVSSNAGPLGLLVSILTFPSWPPMPRLFFIISLAGFCTLFKPLEFVHLSALFSSPLTSLPCCYTHHIYSSFPLFKCQLRFPLPNSTLLFTMTPRIYTHHYTSSSMTDTPTPKRQPKGCFENTTMFVLIPEAQQLVKYPPFSKRLLSVH